MTRGERDSPRCFRCDAWPEELEEYHLAAAYLRLELDDCVRLNEGTYNPRTNTFCCTRCYVILGMPATARGWVAEEPLKLCQKCLRFKSQPQFVAPILWEVRYKGGRGGFGLENAYGRFGRLENAYAWVHHLHIQEETGSPPDVVHLQ